MDIFDKDSEALRPKTKLFRGRVFRAALFFSMIHALPEFILRAAQRLAIAVVLT